MLPTLFGILSLAATLAGGALILRRKGWAERHLWRFLAYGSGILLAITFLHLLPEAWRLAPHWAGGSALAALAALFILEEFTVVHACGEVAEHCERHEIGYGALCALFLHSLADGLAIAFAFRSSDPLGIAVAAAVVVHKFSDGMTLSSLFLTEDRRRRQVMQMVALLSLATPLGIWLGGSVGPWISGRGLASLLGLAAGGFLYVSMADVLPRIHRTRDALCWVFLAAGMATGVLLPHL